MRKSAGRSEGALIGKREPRHLGGGEMLNTKLTLFFCI